MTKIITEKQRELLLLSEGIKRDDFYNLYLYLKNNTSITLNDINLNNEIKDLPSYIDNLLIACQREWKIDENKPYNDLGPNFKNIRRSCDLCGNKPLRHEHRIINIFNGKKLVIGSECAKEFGEEVVGTLEWAKKESEKAVKRKELEITIPGIRKFVDSSNNFTRDLPIILPKQLHDKWENQRINVTRYYNEFVEGKNRDTKQIEKEWINLENIRKAIDRHIDESMNKRYIGRQEIMSWLIENRKIDVLEMIRKDGGYITWATLHRIYEKNFMKNSLNELKEHLLKIGVKYINFNPNTRIVILDFYLDNRSLTTSLPYDILMLNYGGVLFNEVIDDFEFHNILNETKVVGKESIAKVLSLISNNSLEYVLTDRFLDDEEAIFLSENNYYLINVNTLVNSCKALYFSRKVSNSDIDKYILYSQKRIMNKTEYSIYKDVKKETRKLKIKSGKF